MTEPHRRALISVSDKTGVVAFAQALVARGFRLVSTGGTGKALREAGLEVEDAGRLTGYGEFLDGRVKTLHPAIHGGILAKQDDPTHQSELAIRHITPFAVVAVNLYPFRETLAAGADAATVVENIDIGGPAMVRAAAKNFAHVAVVTDPADYERVATALDAPAGLDLRLRRELAAKAFAHTAAYDAAIAGWFQAQADDVLPATLVLAASRVERCRYGENPHQDAAIYRLEGTSPGLVGADVLQGKALSYNNLADADAAWGLVNDLAEPAVVIVKHANPCGVATAPGLADAYAQALAADPTSAFGGIVAVNRPLDAATAEAITRIFTEVVIAPAVPPEARAVLAGKTALRVLEVGDAGLATRHVRTVAGGLLVQTADDRIAAAAGLQVVTERPPSAAELADLLFAQTVCKHVKSNAIVLARGGVTVGVGAGQMSRVEAVRIAASKAAEGLGAKPCVVASDAFFPFADGLELAIQAGATAAIQPGGSKRDTEVIEAANRAGLAMVFTATRHFRH
ncbi:MAG: bifunctional phosphoribosylaminoimidazolecarboxamide formyltransferase/IMP cyclohydrolase PurH [Geminicoccaceae bacterium]|nr:MAG: bifunctional phosphoribosylaminoimidazolecarboxamide formyltransferase/IMP cyclohydrolase PurH [Geminicoccaceae bacterium]